MTRSPALADIRRHGVFCVERDIVMTPESLTLIRQVVREEVDHIFERLKHLEPKPRAWLPALIFSAGALVGLVMALVWDVKGIEDAPGKAIGIPTLVEQVRSELIESERERVRKGQPPLFEMKSVDIEVAFVVKRTDKLGAKFSVSVVDLDAARDFSSEKTHRMTLHLALPAAETVSLPPKP